MHPHSRCLRFVLHHAMINAALNVISVRATCFQLVAARKSSRTCHCDTQTLAKCPHLRGGTAERERERRKGKKLPYHKTHFYGVFIGTRKTQIEQAPQPV